MQSATKLDALLTKIDHPNPVAVLLAKERFSSRLTRLIDRHVAHLCWPGIADELIDSLFDAFKLLRAECFGVVKIKAQPRGIHRGARLGGVFAQYLTKGTV